MKIVINEHQKNTIQKHIISEQKINSIIGVIYDELINEQLGLENPEEKAQRFNKRFAEKYPRGIFHRIFNFGVFGHDDVALAQTMNECFIFINKQGKPVYTFKMDMNKVFKRSELVAAVMNSKTELFHSKKWINPMIPINKD